MRAALWFLALFSVAVALALFAGTNEGTVTLFWWPRRIDLSLNMVLLILLAVFAVLYTALRALSALLALPHQARRWRMLQKERAMHGTLLDAFTHMLAGRFVRARKAALAALAQEKTLGTVGENLPHSRQLRALSHLMVAQSSHSLQDAEARDQHLREVLADAPAQGTALEQALRDGALMRAARWAMDTRDPQAALEWLASMPQGAARRTLALRIKLKATRLSQQTGEALETARLLAKHRAFSPAAAQSLVRSLVTESLNSARDAAQLQKAWASLEAAERAMPEVATHAAQRLGQLGGEGAQVRQWLLPTWEALVRQPGSLSPKQSLQLVAALEASMDSIDSSWLSRLEAAHQANPRDAHLQYLAGTACAHRQLWGKAQQLLTQSTHHLSEPSLRASAWRQLALLAEQRQDDEASAKAWKNAALQAAVR